MYNLTKINLKNIIHKSVSYPGQTERLNLKSVYLSKWNYINLTVMSTLFMLYASDAMPYKTSELPHLIIITCTMETLM